MPMVFKHSMQLLATVGGGGGSSPTWYSGLTAGQWSDIPGTNIDASGVLEGALGNESGAEKLFDSYSGGGLITSGGYFYDGTTQYSGSSFLLYFGGHGQNDLNAIYALPLLQNTPRYKKPRDSTLPPLDSTGQSGITYVPFDGSSNPNAFQTYAAAVYHPPTNKTFWIGGSAMSQNPIDSKYILSFDHGQISPNSNVPWSYSGYATIPTYGDGTQAGCDVVAYEASSNRIWFHRHQVSAIGYYDVAGNSVSEGTAKTPSWSHEGVMACDNTRGILCIVAVSPLGSNTFVINFYRTNNGTANDYYIPSTTGTAPTAAGFSQNNGAVYTPPCVVWNEDADCFVVWWGGKTLWKLSPPASSPYEGGNSWTWTSHTASSGNTPANGPNQGVNGRFQYVKESTVRGYILNNATTENVQFYPVSNAGQGY